MAELEQALLGLTCPDTGMIRRSEQHLKQYMKTAGAIEGFIGQLQQSNHVSVRQLSAVLLRKVINKQWAKVPKESHEPIKQVLLQILVAETENLPRRAIASVISRVAKHQLPGGNWPALLNCISQCATHTEERYREVGMLMLYQQYETVATALSEQFADVGSLFSNGLNDGSIKVRVMALKACGALIEYLALDPKVLIFRELVPQMITVVEQCVSCGVNDAAVQALEVFGEMAQSPSAILKPYLEKIVQSALSIGVTSQVELPVRDAALTIITSLANNKPKTISRMQLVPQIVEALLKINTEPEEDEDEEDEEDDDDDDDPNISNSLTPHNMSNICFDSIAKALPNKYIYAPSVQSAVNAINSGTVDGARAGVNVLGIISEGCASSLAEDLNTLVPLVAKAAESADMGVRCAVCYAFGQWAQYLNEEVAEFHERIMPLLFHLLQDSRPKVQRSSLYFTECICEAMGQEVICIYTDALMGGLTNIVMGQDTPLETRAKAVAAISSTVIANETAIAPYFGTCLPVLEKCLSNTTEEYNMLRGQALQCLGFFAEYVGAEKFAPLSRQSMTIALECLEIEDPEMDEFVFAFFGGLAACLKDDFSEHVGNVVQILLEKATSKDGVDMFERRGDDDALGGGGVYFRR